MENKYISSGRFIWKRFDLPKSEGGIKYSTEIIATATTELMATEITNNLNSHKELKEALDWMLEFIDNDKQPTTYKLSTLRNKINSLLNK